MDESMTLACETSFKRSVSHLPGMADNILLMHIFILDYFGRRYNKPEWIQHSERTVGVCYRRFMENKSFEEYNSPTYYGVDMDALTMLRKYAGSPETRKYADEILTEMWRDVSDFYHPDLKNICGPYLRSYGLDMQKYIAITGGLIFEALGEKLAPFPPLILPENAEKDFEILQLWDVYDAFWSMAIENEIPEEVIPSLTEFKGPHGISKTIHSYPGLQLASAWLDKNYMMGGLYGAGKMYNQLHPFVLHWKGSGPINTMRLIIADENAKPLIYTGSVIDIDVLINKNKADITARRLTPDIKTKLWLEIKCSNKKNSVINNGILNADGLKIKLDGNIGTLKNDIPDCNTAFIPLHFDMLPSGMETMLVNIEIL
jgi:hypothetical protein